MAVEKIKKLFLIASVDHKDAVLETLQKIGVVQIEDVSYSFDDRREGESGDVEQDENSHVRNNIFDWEQVRRPILTERRDIEKHHDELASYVRFLHNYIPERQGFDLLKKGPLTISHKEESEILDNLKNGMQEQIIEEVGKLEKEIKKLHAKRLNLKNRREHLFPWMNLKVPMNYIERTAHTRVRAVSVPLDNVDACREAAAIEDICAVKVGETKSSKNIIIIYHRDSEEAAEKIIRDLDVHIAVFPRENLTPAEMIDVINQEIVALDREKIELEERLQEMNDQLLSLRIAANHLDNTLERKKVQELCGETSCTFLLRGWVPEKKIPLLENEFNRVAPEVDISVTEPGDGEEVPIILNNSKLISPFEVVIDIFGKPNYREFDPTPSVALFFFIGFGYCLTDAGYGLMLALIFGLAVWKLKLAKGAKQFCKLLALSGISSTIFGALTGSWFGNLFTASEYPVYHLGIWKILNPIQQMDPLGKHIVYFLGAAFVVGYFQLCWGVCTRIVQYLYRGKIRDALLSPFPILLFMAGLVVLAFNRTVAMWICIASIVIMLFFAGRENKNIFLRLGSGLWQIYGMLTGLLSDVLSYSRLFALGLATGIMATVINIIAFMLWPIPWVGWFLCLIVLIVAHPINLVINVLGAFIHTARLQFVEYFPKFYENGGKAFSPFTMKNRYLHVVNDFSEEKDNFK